VSRSITISQLYRSGRRDLIVHNTEFHCPDFSHELLQQENVNILVANDGGHKDDYGSFWLGDRNGNGNHMGLSRRRTRLSNAVSPRGRMAACPYLFLTHYIRYYGIKTSDNLRVTSYCDSESLSRIFHTRDVDSSSWYLKSDHDVIMKLSSVREGLPFELISRHVKSHQDDKYEYDDLTRPEQLNV
jgi:hypothetical protein